MSLPVSRFRVVEVEGEGVKRVGGEGGKTDGRQVVQSSGSSRPASRPALAGLARRTTRCYCWWWWWWSALVVVCSGAALVLLLLSTIAL
jgi:hypothetical protein